MTLRDLYLINNRWNWNTEVTIITYGGENFKSIIQSLDDKYYHANISTFDGNIVYLDLYDEEDD